MVDYIKKIKNLLDLAKSPNEHEARSALLMARKLMVKHKILEKDLEDVSHQKVEERMTGITFSARRDLWISNLAGTVAKHHCCGNFQRRQKGKQTAEVGFIGFTEDITICMEVFKYAVDCIRLVTDKYRKTKDSKAADGYGYGFVSGLMNAYEMQQTEEGWGLVLVVPDEVNKELNGMRKKKHSNKRLKESDVYAFRKGEQDGKKFDMTKRLKKEE